MQQEIWKDIPGYSGLYQVSNFGRIKGLSRIVKNKARQMVVRTKIKKPQTNKRNGRLFISLSKDGIKKTYSIHRLVAMAFIPNPNNLPQINHKDENPKNNNVENLEWCTAYYNTNYGNGIAKRAKLKSKAIYQIDKTTHKIITRFDSLTQAQKKTGIDKRLISKVICGEHKTAGNYYWILASKKDKYKSRRKQEFKNNNYGLLEREIEPV